MENINEVLKEKASLIPKPNEEIRGYGITAKPHYGNRFGLDPRFKARGLSERVKENINRILKNEEE